METKSSVNLSFLMMDYGSGGKKIKRMFPQSHEKVIKALEKHWIHFFAEELEVFLSNLGLSLDEDLDEQVTGRALKNCVDAHWVKDAETTRQVLQGIEDPVAQTLAKSVDLITLIKNFDSTLAEIDDFKD